MGTFADGQLAKMLDAWTGTATYTANAAVYVQLHTGDPGSAGTSNVAACTTRKAAAFAAASAGTATTNAAVTWTGADGTASETLTWVSFWTASSAGTFLGRDDLPSSKVVTAGDTITIASGDIDLSI